MKNLLKKIENVTVYKNNKKFNDNTIKYIISPKTKKTTFLTLYYRNKKMEYFAYLVTPGVKLTNIKYENNTLSFVWNGIFRNEFKKNKNNCSCDVKVSDKYKIIFNNNKDIDLFKELYENRMILKSKKIKKKTKRKKTK